jgi:hypothetical protein
LEAEGVARASRAALSQWTNLSKRHKVTQADASLFRRQAGVSTGGELTLATDEVRESCSATSSLSHPTLEQ